MSDTAIIALWLDQGKMRLRNLPVGAHFILLRTGEHFRFVRKDITTPSGVRYVVARTEDKRECTLHHACYVRPVHAPVHGDKWRGVLREDEA